MATFVCQGCGECCKHLTETKHGFTTGMLLTAKEKDLFSEADVSPAFCADDKIILWQLNKPVCPMLSKTDNSCLIYPSRPLVCRSFPIVNSAISIKCGAADGLSFLPNEREQCEKFKRYMTYRIEGVKELLRFDLAANQWRRA